MENRDNSIWLSKARELYNVTQERLALEKKEHTLALELRDLSDYKPYSYGGLNYFIESRLGPVDYCSIPELNNVDLNKYRKAPVKVWKLKVEVSV
jgi:hypothetical protein